MPKSIFQMPSELSRENMISSHVKRSLLLWLHMKIAPFDAFRETIYYFIGVYIINRILHDHLEVRNFTSRVEKQRIIGSFSNDNGDGKENVTNLHI